MVYNWKRLLFPPTCLICGQPGHGDQDICHACLESLPRNQSCCIRCALPLPKNIGEDLVCGSCSATPTPFDRIIAPWLYKEPMDLLIQQLKFHKKLPAGRLLGQLLARKIPPHHRPELLLPVPLHTDDLKARGFNHAGEIARSLSHELDIPWSPWLLKKTRKTRPQHHLGKMARRSNLRNAFHFNSGQEHHHIAIIDDVVTTSATATEVSLALRRSGVEKIDVWVVARTVRET